MIQQKMWAVGGGKGGIGKSVLTVSLSLWLAKLGKQVIVVDADLGGANLNILLGIRYPNVTLEDFIKKEVDTLEETLIDTPHKNLKLICGAGDILGLANPKYTQKMRLLRHLGKLDADFILLDLGAGTSYNVLDFFLYANGKIAVFSPQATSLQNVYSFIKSSLLRYLHRNFNNDISLSPLLARFTNGIGTEKINSVSELKKVFRQVGEEEYLTLCKALDSFDIKIVINMVKKDTDHEISKVLQMVSEKYLDIHITDFGSVEYDAEIEKSINRMVPFLMDNSQCKAAMSTYQIAYGMIRENGSTPPVTRHVHSDIPTTPLSAADGSHLIP